MTSIRREFFLIRLHKKYTVILFTWIFVIAGIFISFFLFQMHIENLKSKFI